MFGKKEISAISIAIIIMSIVILFADLKSNINSILWIDYGTSLSYSALIILTAVFTKKIVSSAKGINIEHQIWKLKRYGLYRRSYFKKFSIPLGVLLPLLLVILTNGFTKFFAFIQFEAKALPSRVAKKYGWPRFSELKEADLSHIAFYGIASTLALAIISYFLGFGELAKYSVYYSIANLIPFGNLDGLKILLGSEPLKTNLSSAPIKIRKMVFIPSPLYLFSLILTISVSLIILL